MNLKITKIVMYVTRIHNGERQFLVLNRKSDDTYFVPTGHVGDNVANETLTEAAKRELMEELAIEPLKIVDLNHSVEIFLTYHQAMSEEHAFLLEVSDVEVKYLERDDEPSWHSLAEMKSILTYDGQKGAIPKILKYFNEQK